MRHVVSSFPPAISRSWHTGLPVPRPIEANSVSPVSGFLNWWDSVELWLSGLPFVLQALAVMPMVLALAYLTAGLLDALLGRGIRLMRRARHSDETLE